MHGSITRALALFGMGALLLLASCGKKAADVPPGDSTASAQKSEAAGPEEQNIARSREFLEKVFNQKDTAAIAEYMAPTFVEHNPIPGGGTDIAAFRKWLSEWFAMAPDSKITIDDIIAQGDKVVIRNTMTGTNTGPMMGAPATNKPFKVEGIDIIRIENGKAVEHWGQMDVMGMMTQLGMMKDGGEHNAAAGADAHAGTDSTGKK